MIEEVFSEFEILEKKVLRYHMVCIIENLKNNIGEKGYIDSVVPERINISNGLFV